MQSSERSPRFAELDRAIAQAAPREAARRRRRRTSELAQQLDVEPWEVRRAKYLMAAERAEDLEREGLAAVAARLRSKR